MTDQLERAIHDTVRYFDIFELPITATQVWERLVLDEKSDVRWEGHRSYSLLEVQDTLRNSEWLDVRLGMQWGYYFLRGKDDLVEKRLDRHTLAQDKWKIMRRVSKMLSVMPFVRGLAGSGSLALDNTKESSDLDLLIIVKARRIWTARLGLLIVSQLLGRRRKYWNTEAPDMMCLNHYVTDEKLVVSPDIQNMYTAVAYSSFVPVYGREVVEKFQEENGSWIRPRVMSPDLPGVKHMYEVVLFRGVEGVKQFFEQFLLEPVGDVIERVAEKIQRLVIERHHDYGRAGRVVVSNEELAFHPDTKVPAILKQFALDPGQQVLL